MIKRSKLRRIPVLLAGAGFIAWSVSSGGSGHELRDSTAIRAPGVAADRSFVELMIPLNRQLAAISDVARTEVMRPQLRKFAALQLAEVASLNRRLTGFADLIGARVALSRIPPLLQLEGDSGALGQTVADSGFQLRLGRRLGPAIGRRIINLAISIDQGAVRLARVAYLQGSVTPLQHLALSVIYQRIRDINTLNRWYRSWYGRSAPAGGVPVGQ